MAKTKIWKFSFSDILLSYKAKPWEFKIVTPKNTEPLHFACDESGEIFMWGRFYSENEGIKESQRYYVVPTGEEFTINGKYMATVIQLSSTFPFVFHIFKGPVYSHA